MQNDTQSNELNTPKSPDGYVMGQSSTDKIGFYGATAIVRRADASQVAFTDSSAGTVSDTIAAGVGKTTLAVHLTLAELADGDIITTLTPGYKFKILAVDFFVEKAVTTGSKASTLNLEIGTTNLTGGAVALTSANCTPKGAKVAGTAVTAGNTGSATDTISVEAASTTTFVEGSGWLVITIQNMDVADAFASVADKVNEIRTTLYNLGLWAGAAS